MKPAEVYRLVGSFLGEDTSAICALHSACSPLKGKKYQCGEVGSHYPVLDFDSVKIKADIEARKESRKSVDALALTPSDKILCFIELKSWELLINNKGDEKKVRKQAEKYSSDLPLKLSDSLEICREIVGDHGEGSVSQILYILITDISVVTNGLEAFDSDLSALAGISSNLNMLCNRLSTDIMQGIPNVETRYWECRDFDHEISKL